ncbi:MAG: spermidine dehydrogenase [Rhodospirillaceae bacterium]|nr:MAG: spermidine dehydrogenase [Rhodospirillaceae bacterium]
MTHKQMTRRDFLNGTLIGTGALLVGGDLMKIARAAEVKGETYYPPRLTGMRGSHPGSFERAHELAREGRDDWGGIVETGEDYDLVVVGGGASGLAAAYFFQDANDWKAKVLILDNHDDFGGHAKRNEFESGGKMRMTYGGSQGFDNISNWPDEMWDLMDDLGIDLERFESETYDHSWYKRHGLGGGVYLDAETWGSDHMMPGDLGGMAPVMPGLGKGSNDFAALFAATPLPDEAKKELIKLYSEDNSYAVIKRFDEDDPNYDSYPYDKFLRKYWGISHPATFQFLRKLPTDENGVGAEVLSLSEAIGGEMPGCVTLGKKYGMIKDDEPGDPGYAHHFPDGNAGFCRSLVHALISEVAPDVGELKSAEDLVLADFDYAALDDVENDTRIRLNSTAIEVKHEGPVDDAETVAVTYIFDGKPHRVRASNVIMACWNMVIPYVCPDLPEPQKEALSSNVKIPYIFANVMVKNWQAIKKSGVGAAYCPTSYYHLMQCEYPVNMGGYEATEDANEPMPITLIRVPVPDELGMEPRDQFREGRSEVLVTEFSEYEEAVKTQLNGMYGAYGFNADRDIESLTLNRWSHGYSYTYFNLFDKGMTTDDGPHILARKQFGRIAIANSDAGANSWLDVGVMQGLRAVRELTGDEK